MTNEAKVPEIRSCPFCGASVTGIAPYPLDDEQYAVCCPKCNAQGGYNGGNDSTSPAEAIAAWNTRAPDERIARLEADRGACVEALKEAKEFIENLQLPDAEWERVLDLLVAALARLESGAK